MGAYDYANGKGTTNFKIGMKAPEAVVKIIEMNPSITLACFKIITSTRNNSGEKPTDWGNVSLERMVAQAPKKEKKFWLEKEEITIKTINKIINDLEEKQYLCVCSEVMVVGRSDGLHIPMMDFKCDVSSENLEKIQEFFQIIGKKGIIIVSGKSYHYYGIELLSEREWVSFCGQCLLFNDNAFNPYVDIRYIGHRLIDGFAGLRISKDIRRIMPEVVAILD